MSDDGEEFYKKRASWLQDMWDAEREELNACLKRSNEYFLEYCKERDALRAENEQLRRDVKTAVMGDSAELADMKRENEKLREAIKPFVKWTDEYRRWDDKTKVMFIIKVGDLRAASAAIRDSGNE